MPTRLPRLALLLSLSCSWLFALAQADLAVRLEVATPVASIGEAVVARVYLVNEGSGPRAPAVVALRLTDALTLVGTEGNARGFEPATARWSVRGLDAGERDSLDVVVEPLAGGLHVLTAELVEADGEDWDSAPGNGETREDDQREACITVPIGLACGQVAVLRAPPGRAIYRWYRNDTLLTYATSDTLHPGASGAYRYTLGDGGCAAGACCPVLFEREGCAADVALVFTHAAAPSGGVHPARLRLRNEGAEPITRVDFYVTTSPYVRLAEAGNESWLIGADRVRGYRDAVIAPGAEATVDFDLEVLDGGTPDDYVLFAEVSGFYDGWRPLVDADSSPDEDPGNDLVADDGIGLPPSRDEDDSDVLDLRAPMPAADTLSVEIEVGEPLFLAGLADHRPKETERWAGHAGGFEATFTQPGTHEAVFASATGGGERVVRIEVVPFEAPPLFAEPSIATTTTACYSQDVPLALNYPGLGVSATSGTVGAATAASGERPGARYDLSTLVARGLATEYVVESWPGVPAAVGLQGNLQAIAAALRRGGADVYVDWASNMLLAGGPGIGPLRLNAPGEPTLELVSDSRVLPTYGTLYLRPGYAMVTAALRGDRQQASVALTCERPPVIVSDGISFDLGSGFVFSRVGSDGHGGAPASYAPVADGSRARPAPPLTVRYLRDTLALRVGERRRYCPPAPRADAAVVDLVNECEGESGERATVAWDGDCVSVEAYEAGTEEICLRRCYRDGGADSIQVALEIAAPPELDVVADVDTVAFGQFAVLEVLSNDALPEGPRTVSLVSEPYFGRAQVVGGVAIEYLHYGGECATDVFTYEVCQGGTCDSATVELSVYCGELLVYNGLSPNGDGVNEEFTIRGLERYPNHEVMIFDREGRLMTSMRDYANDWTGDVNGVPLTAGIYFYVIDLGNGETRSGYLQLSR